MIILKQTKDFLILKDVSPGSVIKFPVVGNREDYYLVTNHKVDGNYGVYTVVVSMTQGIYGEIEDIVECEIVEGMYVEGQNAPTTTC